MTRTIHVLMVCGAMSMAAGTAKVGAQATGQASPAGAPAAQDAPTPSPNYVYAVDGRRDPFVALIMPGGQQRGTTGVDAPVRGEGLAGMTVDEVVVRGIIESQGEWVAMVTGPARRVYTARPGDKLADGVVQSITPQALILQQYVNDPLSLEKQREVRKFLRGGENK